MAQILVTGGAGYIGSILCEHLLNAGYQVSVIDNLIYRQPSLLHFCSNPRFRFFNADARDERLVKALVKESDVIVPLACIVGAPACNRDPWTARSVNLEAVRLINHLRSPSQLLVFPCTNSGYGTRSSEVYCTEETPMEPISLYGQLKVEAERELLDSPNTITLRLATVFGASPRIRLDLLVNQFVYSAVTEGTISLFEAHFKRNFVHIRDVADCFVYCIEHADRMVGRPYNVGLDSANLSKEELALKIRQYVTNLQIHFAETGTDPDKRNYIVSNQRLREVGFEASRSLDEGILELITAYKMIVGPGPNRNM